MPSLQTLLMLALLGIACFAVICFVLLVVLYRRNETKERERLEQMRTDITDMSVLFQTMRDIVAQQKALAQEFNKELNKKMTLVKEVLSRGLEKNERLYEQQQTLAREVEETQAQLESIQRQMADLPGAPAPAPPKPKATPETSRNADAEPAPAPRSLHRTPPAQPRPRPTPEERRPTAPEEAFADWPRMDLDSWTSDSGLETERTQPPSGHEEEPAPEQPEDPEAARQAFRALLDMAPGHTTEPSSFDGASASGAKPAAASDHDNDGAGGVSAPVQRRVLEYSQAGMTVTQIARELGIGKGEVRLMLSLSKQTKR